MTNNFGENQPQRVMNEIENINLQNQGVVDLGVAEPNLNSNQKKSGKHSKTISQAKSNRASAAKMQFVNSGKSSAAKQVQSDQ